MFRSKKYKFNQSAFTLVELLVVISIIGILSSFAIVSLNSARVKARDALRKGDMAQLRTALSMYYDDNLRYPECGSWVADESQDFGAVVGDVDPEGCWCFNNTLATALSAGSRPIMQSLPKDPKNPANSCAYDGVLNYRYVSVANGDEYAVIYTLEDGGEQIMRGW
jgi:prepilin-type N-terminal cleavage/methylation domain-containing protein